MNDLTSRPQCSHLSRGADGASSLSRIKGRIEPESHYSLNHFANERSLIMGVEAAGKCSAGNGRGLPGLFQVETNGHTVIHRTEIVI